MFYDGDLVDCRRWNAETAKFRAGPRGGAGLQSWAVSGRKQVRRIYRSPEVAAALNLSSALPTSYSFTVSA
ncbi:MAG TPA: hypothetical protein VGR76_04820, partial [Candidatus Angelobacter sp.]|nr:hypothetical protein [Candidatus Angelobacter sp.]